MKTSNIFSRTSLTPLVYVPLLICCSNLPVDAQNFSFRLYALDAAGNKDTITLGYSQHASTAVDPAVGERNIIKQKPRPGLDVRVTNAYGMRGKDVAEPYETKLKWLPYRCMGEEVGFDLAIYTMHWPVTLSWDPAGFADSCHSASVVSNVRMSMPLLDNSQFELEMAEAGSVKLSRLQLDRYDNPHHRMRLGLLSGAFRSPLTVQVPLVFDSPAEKPGWNLIFSDDFDGTQLDPLKWHISDHDNDGTFDCDPSSNRNIPVNPANVSVSNGMLRLKVSADPYDGCDYSGAEVKTFGWDNQWATYFRKAGYLEIRAKLPIEEGVGSAAWLYTGNGPKYSEIDLWETQGVRHHFSATYHWDLALQGLNRRQSGRRVVVEHLDTVWWPFGPAPYYAETDLTQHFITYGLEWGDSSVRWYVNGQLARTVDFTQTGRPWSGFPPEEELWLRLTAGGDLCLRPNNDFCFPDTASLPHYLEVDYVRVYIKEGHRAIRHHGTGVLCNTVMDFTMRLSHYPYASYQFSAPWITAATPHVWGVYNMAWYLKTNGLQLPHQFNPVAVSTAFPSGYVETDTIGVKVGSNPVPPTGPIQFQPFNNTCLYRAMVPRQQDTDNYYWSVNGGATYTAGIDMVIAGTNFSTYGPVSGGTGHTYRVRVENFCGFDDSFATYAQAPNGNSQPGCIQKRHIDSKDSRKLDIPEWITEVRIFSITGAMVRKMAIEHLDLDRLRRELSPGVYLVQYLAETGRVWLSGKMVIAR